MKRWIALLFVGLALELTACAHKGVQGTDNTLTSGAAASSGDATDQVAVAEDGGPIKEIPSFRVTDPEQTQEPDPELENIPEDAMVSVNKWIDYFTGRGRPHMERYLSRSTRYMKLMKKILRDNGLPEDLIYISLIESGFSPRATSHAAAVGYWQFIRSTGRRYGLEINQFVDERRDPVLSTQAAAEYFKELYNVFGSWFLSMASYNVGEGRVKREVASNYTRDFWAIARVHAHKRRRDRHGLPRETIEYVPKFLAAKMIARDPAKYGFTDLDYEPPIEFEHVKLTSAVNLRTMATKMNMQYEEFKRINPKFKGEVAPTKKDGVLELRVPIGQTEVAMNAAKESAVDKLVYVADQGETDLYKVRKGDTVGGIARKFHTSIANLRDLNNMTKKSVLRVGSRIYVPERSQGLAYNPEVRKPVETAQPAVAPSSFGDERFYFVQRGDTLSTIAERYGTSIAEIKKANRLSRGRTLRAGVKIRIPSGNHSDSNSEVVKKNESSKNTQSREIANVVQTSLQAASAAAVNSAIAAGPSVHVVQPGESLFVIAKKYGTTVQALQRSNNLSRRSVLKVGSTLRIDEASVN